MKYSIRRQITAIFIGLLVFILGGVLIINNGFLGTYYLSHKSQELLRTYNEVDRMFAEDKLSESSSYNNILMRTEKANVDLVVINAGGNAVLSTLGTGDPRFKEMTVGLLMGVAGVNVSDVIRQTDAYTIYRDDAQGVTGDVEYLKMCGRLSDGSWFIMQSPLGASKIVLSTWVCGSMKPGVTVLPAAWMTVCAVSSGKVPMAAICPSLTAISAV